MSRISTHVLDTALGCPAAGIPVRLYCCGREIAHAVTDEDGRCSSLLPENTSLETGTYRILFEVAARFPDGFYSEVSVCFRVADVTSHYHVPLLISPFGYTTYRGS